MNANNKPFHFYTQQHLIKLLAIKAGNPLELLKGIKKVPLSSVYYHTHRFLQIHNYLCPEPPNDFAYWLTTILNLNELAESVASIDIITYKNLEDIRLAFIRILEEYTSKRKTYARCPEGLEFHFMACTSFILPTPYAAHNLKEFLEILKKVSVSSLYFHIFEARMRLEKDENDFVAWFKGMGMDDLAKELARLDPYTITFDGLRKKIISTVEKYERN
ncbi:MAG: DUF5752 family protein [Armatimonadota bacterium]